MEGRNTLQKYLPYITAAAALLPAMLLRDFTPSNELRYLSIADEALESGNFFAFSNHGVAYADKPPLYFWLIMLCRLILGEHRMWAMCLFSAVPALVILRTMDKWAACELGSGKVRQTARTMLISCGLFLGIAATMRMDMLMCMFIVLSLKAFWDMSTNPDHPKHLRWLFPIYIFLALFTKGPVGILVPLVSTATYLFIRGRAREIPRYWGLRTWAVLAALCALWFTGAWAEGGKDYLNNLLFHQTIDRAVNSFHHDEPFYYYALCIWYIMAPWSLLVVGTVTASLRKGFPKSELNRFFLTTALSTIVMLSLISSKLQIYLIPAFPFLVYSAALSLRNIKENRLLSASVLIPSALFALVLPVVLYLALTGKVPMLRNPWVYAAAACGTLSGIAAIVRIIRGHDKIRDAVACLSSGLLAAVFAFGCFFPTLNPQIGFADLSSKALELSQEHGTKNFCIWMINRAENIDVFLHSPVSVLAPDSGGSGELPPDLPQECILLLPADKLPPTGEGGAKISWKYAAVYYNAAHGDTPKPTTK